jgi:hypothetical protein
LCVELGVILTVVQGLMFVCRTGCRTDSCTGPCVVAVYVELGVILTVVQGLVFVCRTGCHTDSCTGICVVAVCIELVVTLGKAVPCVSGQGTEGVAYQ